MRVFPCNIMPLLILVGSQFRSMTPFWAMIISTFFVCSTRLFSAPISNVPVCVTTNVSNLILTLLLVANLMMPSTLTVSRLVSLTISTNNILPCGTWRFSPALGSVPPLQVVGSDQEPLFTTERFTAFKLTKLSAA